MPSRPLTPEQKEDAKRLQRLFVEWQAKQPGKVTQEDLVGLLGNGQSGISQRLNGQLAINMKFAMAVSKLIDKPVRAISPSIADEIDEISEFATPNPVKTDEAAKISNDTQVDLSFTDGCSLCVECSKHEMRQLINFAH